MNWLNNGSGKEPRSECGETLCRFGSLDLVPSLAVLKVIGLRSIVWMVALASFCLKQMADSQTGSEGQPGSNAAVVYQNYRLGKGPWSINVVRVPRTGGIFQIKSTHAYGSALGLSTLTDQTKIVSPNVGTPVAAINGDFYQRDGAYAGDPRGLQIVEGELISAPNGGLAFWIDAIGDPHTSNTVSNLQVKWPDGTLCKTGLNGPRPPGGVQLYTPAMGQSTRTKRGRELVLVQQGKGPWLPLKAGKEHRAMIIEIHDVGDTRIPPGTMILSIDPGAANRFQHIEAGMELSISTATEPRLRGVKTAIGGGPVLVRDGEKQSIKTSASESYVVTSMLERHPRSAIGWNEESFFLVEVDGRQPGFSVGMTLSELASYLVQLGCQEALNLDGGGSATLWFSGKVQNRPCDRAERPVANSLVVVKKPLRKPNALGNNAAPSGK